MKIKFPIKLRNYTNQDILSLLPENYQDYNYCEPFCSGSDIYLNKEISLEEVICDTNKKFIKILKCIRDDYKDFLLKLKKIKNYEKTFVTSQKKDIFEDYFEEGINEYILLKLSRGGKKKNFYINEENWKKDLTEIVKISERLKSVLILSDQPDKVIDYWNDEKSIIYVNPPAVDQNEEDFTIDDHIKILNLLKISKAKVLISVESCTLYNRMLKGWKNIKKKTEENTYIIWKNY